MVLGPWRRACGYGVGYDRVRANVQDVRDKCVFRELVSRLCEHRPIDRGVRGRAVSVSECLLTAVSCIVCPRECSVSLLVAYRRCI